MKAIQQFSPEYLERCQQMSPEEIAQFLDQFRQIHAEKAKPAKSKLISMKVPEDLLATFKIQAELEGIAYQTKIKQLMAEWLRYSS